MKRALILLLIALGITGCTNVEPDKVLSEEGSVVVQQSTESETLNQTIIEEDKKEKFKSYVENLDYDNIALIYNSETNEALKGEYKKILYGYIDKNVELFNNDDDDKLYQSDIYNFLNEFRNRDIENDYMDIKIDEILISSQFYSALRMLDYVKYNNFDYSSALEILEGIPNTHPLYNNALEEIKKINEKVNNLNLSYALIDEKILSFTSYVDPVTEDKILVAKGLSTEFINISREINFETRIFSTKFMILPYIVIGFENDDWIFFDTIYFNVDGNKYSINVEYSDQNTQVHGNGNISEWTNISIEENSYGLTIDDFKEIANSKSALIKFSGQGSITHEITAYEKEQLKNAIELFELVSTNKLEAYLFKK